MGENLGINHNSFYKHGTKALVFEANVKFTGLSLLREAHRQLVNTIESNNKAITLETRLLIGRAEAIYHMHKQCKTYLAISRG